MGFSLWHWPVCGWVHAGNGCAAIRLDDGIRIWAQGQGWRREPLEKRRDGLVEGHRTVLMIARNEVIRSFEWVDDLKPVDHPFVLHIFAEENFALRLLGRANEHRVPK